MMFTWLVKHIGLAICWVITRILSYLVPQVGTNWFYDQDDSSDLISKLTRQLRNDSNDHTLARLVRRRRLRLRGWDDDRWPQVDHFPVQIPIHFFRQAPKHFSQISDSASFCFWKISCCCGCVDLSFSCLTEFYLSFFSPFRRHRRHWRRRRNDVESSSRATRSILVEKKSPNWVKFFFGLVWNENVFWYDPFYFI